MDLLCSENLRGEMGIKGYQHVKEDFLIPRLMEDWIDLWIEILS